MLFLNYQNVTYLDDASYISGRLRLYIWTICASHQYGWFKNQWTIGWVEMAFLGLMWHEREAVVQFDTKYQSHSMLPYSKYILIYVKSQTEICYISGWFMLHIWAIEFTYLDDLWLAFVQESYVSMELIGYLIFLTRPAVNITVNKVDI